MEGRHGEKPNPKPKVDESGFSEHKAALATETGVGEIVNLQKNKPNMVRYQKKKIYVVYQAVSIKNDPDTSSAQEGAQVITFQPRQKPLAQGRKAA